MPKNTLTELTVAAARAAKDLEQWEGGAIGHNNRRRAMLALLSKLRQTLDREYPHKKQRKRRKPQSPKAAFSAHIEAGWVKVVRWEQEELVLGGARLKEYRGCRWVRDWEREILLNCGKRELREAQRSPIAREALLASIALSSL
jgi:hypothetical protein